MWKNLVFLVVLCSCLTLSQSLFNLLGGLTSNLLSLNSHCHHWDFQKNNAFEEAGVREPELSQIKRAKNELVTQLRNYFVYRYQNQYTKDALYDATVVFSSLLNVIEEKYWSEVDNIILGNNNSVKGRENFVNGNSQNVKGDSNYILNGNNPRVKNTPLHDENVVRIGGFDVDLD